MNKGQYKTTILVFILFFLLSIIVLTQIIKNRPTTNINNQNPQINTSNNLVQIENINVVNNQTIDVSTPIVVNFSKPIPLNSLEISIQPFIQTNLIMNESNTQLTIIPERNEINAWMYNQNYILKLSSPLLNKKYDIIFKTEIFGGI